MTKIVSFTLNDKDYCVNSSDVTGWNLNYGSTGIVLILHGYTLVDKMCSISNVCLGEKCFPGIPAIIGTVDNSTKIIIIRSQFKP